MSEELRRGIPWPTRTGKTFEISEEKAKEAEDFLLKRIEENERMKVEWERQQEVIRKARGELC